MNLHYTIQGNEQGQAIVFLHGMAGSSRYWERLISRMPLDRNKFICIDLLGYGLSPKPDDVDYGYSDHLSAIESLIEKLGLNDFKLFGHSMGALLALRLAATNKFRINSLVLINMPYYDNPTEARQAITRNSRVRQLVFYGRTSNFICNVWCFRLRPITKHIAPYYLRNLSKEAAEDSLLHTWKSYDGSLRNVIEHQTVMSDLQSVSAPTTVVYGSKDPTYESFMRMNDSLEQVPNFSLKVVEGAGHHVPLTNPDFLLPLILS